MGVKRGPVITLGSVTRLFTTRYPDPISGISDAQFFQGFDVAALAAATNLRPDARYTQADQWLGARTIRLQARFSF